MSKKISLDDIQKVRDKLNAKVDNEKLDMEERIQALALMQSLDMLIFTNTKSCFAKRRKEVK